MPLALLNSSPDTTSSPAPATRSPISNATLRVERLIASATLGAFAASSYLCTTIEGNTNDDGSCDGWKTCIKSRVFKKSDGHRFIRWGALA